MTFTPEEKHALDKIKQFDNLETRLVDLLTKAESNLRHPQEIFDERVRNARKELNEREKNIKEKEKQIEENYEAIEKIYQEKSIGFPWLAKAFANYSYLQKLKEADRIESKSHPAPISAEKVREIARERKVIEEKLRVAQGVLTYYQELFPFLEEFLGEDDEEILKKVLSQNIVEPIKEVGEIGVDPVRILLRLSEEDYRNLSTAEKNQRALDNWKKSKKNNWQIGKEYERYIGYLYEKKGYSVYYKGILEGYEDLGRDLICKKENETIIIQCKRWSQHKKIHEKHINQLFGTVIKYAIDHPNEKVNPALYTTTEFSDRAKEFAKYLGIYLVKEFPLQEYPLIKCNISYRNGEKIYHLPFDQQYDRTIIEEERNECYVETVEEAEKLGFRRAFRWRGHENNKDSE